MVWYVYRGGKEWVEGEGGRVSGRGEWEELVRAGRVTCECT